MFFAPNENSFITKSVVDGCFHDMRFNACVKHASVLITWLLTILEQFQESFISAELVSDLVQ